MRGYFAGTIVMGRAGPEGGGTQGTVGRIRGWVGSVNVVNRGGPQDTVV